MKIRPSGGTTLGREFGVNDVLEQRYEIEQVRRGYMGIVYIAYDRQRRGRVAIKTFQNKFLWDDEAIGRFNAEAELWMRLGSHPNIVRAYDLRSFLGKPHVVAEYVHGGPLRMLVSHLAFQEALDYAIQICWGMAYAVDQAAIMHCDLKPDNIMVTIDGQAKVTDFGLARVLPVAQWSAQAHDRAVAAKVRARASESLGGTVPYMAPELFDQMPYAGTWSDIYAFGVMLFELFTGRLPFDSMRDESLIRMHRHQPPINPREIRPSLPPGAAEIVLRCLAKQQASRYQSFHEVERDLQIIREQQFGAPYTVVWPSGSSVERDRLTDSGQMHMDLGEISEALTCFRKAVELDPSQPNGWLYLGRARLRQWQYNEALRAVEEGLARATSRHEFGQLYQLRGEAYAAMMRPTDAVAAYDQGLSYTPNAPALWRERGALFFRMGALREAEQCITKALKFDALDAQSLRLIGDVYIAKGQLKQAHRAIGESLKLDPRSAVGWARYGQCQLKLDRPQEALRSFDAALKLDPNLQEAIEGMRTARQARK